MKINSKNEWLVEWKVQVTDGLKLEEVRRILPLLLGHCRLPVNDPAKLACVQPSSHRRVVVVSLPVFVESP